MLSHKIHGLNQVGLQQIGMDVLNIQFAPPADYYQVTEVAALTSVAVRPFDNRRAS